jgi:hypothetical protein
VSFAYGDDGPTRYTLRGLAEWGIACREDAVRDAINGVGLQVARTYFGSWSGRQQYLSYQDILVLARR